MKKLLSIIIIVMLMFLGIYSSENIIDNEVNDEENDEENDSIPTLDELLEECEESDSFTIDIDKLLKEIQDEIRDSLIIEAYIAYSDNEKWAALQLIDKANSYNKTNIGYYLKGLIEYELRHFKKSKYYFQNISKDYENLDEVYNYLGLICSELYWDNSFKYKSSNYYYKKEWEYDYSKTAEDYFRQAIFMNPDEAVYYYNLGYEIMGDGRVNEANRYFKKSLEKGFATDKCKGMLLFTYFWLEQDYLAYKTYCSLDNPRSDQRELIPSRYFETRKNEKSGCLF